MAYMEWSQALEVGHTLIDEEHRSLVDALNSLHAALEQGQEREEIDGILTFLRDYTVRHFATEESMMVQHRYPGAAAHFAAHADLVLRVSDFLVAFRAGREVLTEAVLAFLDAWLVEHIQGLDRELGLYLKERNAAA